MPDESKLIEDAKNGNETSCTKILNLYKGRIFSYVLRLIKNHDDAEEITYEVFIKFFRTLKSFDTTKSISSYLFTIAHNLVIDFFRKNRVEYENLDESHSVDENFLGKYEKDKKLKAIERALSKLSPIDREIVLLFHKEDYSYEEISEILKLPVSTIKPRLHRARKKLRKIMSINPI